MSQPVGPRALSLTVTALLLLGAGCSRSTEALEDAVDGLPDVVSVKAEEDDVSDDDIPFATIPKYVTVRMEADATADHVLDVFDTYEDDVDDGEVTGIEVSLDGAKQATLATGSGIHASNAVAEELVNVQQDPTIVEYRRQVYPSSRVVRVRLGRAGMPEVLRAADRFAASDQISDVDVASGDFSVIRYAFIKKTNKVAAAAREQFVREVADRYRLLGASVGGSAVVELCVDPVVEATLLAYLRGLRADEKPRKIEVHVAGRQAC